MISWVFSVIFTIIKLPFLILGGILKIIFWPLRAWAEKLVKENQNDRAENPEKWKIIDADRKKKEIEKQLDKILYKEKVAERKIEREKENIEELNEQLMFRAPASAWMRMDKNEKADLLESRETAEKKLRVAKSALSKAESELLEARNNSLNAKIQAEKALLELE